MSSGCSWSGGAVNPHNVDAVVEVLPEFALSDHFAEVLMGGKDKRGPQRDKTVAAKAAELTLLENAQEFDLRATG